ncbi:PilZ domain-containing protein [Pleionea sediminis]|uniref:PilZ domain-containing protein n=1 Tax=Pleionea sediminis TaxID=2569479 RepID=UPI0011868A76|nr:PilZ domain-containing protein [Pleionea sediminis]
MSQNEERREFFRIDDCVTMQLIPFNASDGKEVKALPEEFEILNQLRKVELESAQTFRAIQEKHRDIAHYLKVQNEKFDILANYIANQLKGSFEQEKVNISGNGLQFTSPKPYPINSRWHLKLLLFPDCYGLYCEAKVVKCDPVKDAHKIAIEFRNLHERDQDALIKHITKLQSKKLRQQRLSN